MKLLASITVKGVLLAYILSVFPANASDADADISDALEATDKRNCSKAFSLLENARKKTPNDYSVYLVTGAIYVRCGKLKQSMQFYSKAISLAKHVSVQNQYTKSDIAVAYRAIGSNANAISYGKEAAILFDKAGNTSQVEKIDMLINDLESRKIVGQL